MEVQKMRIERAEQINLFKQELRKRPIAGDVYSQATDIEEEHNGLMNAGTGELKVPENLLNSRKDDNIKVKESSRLK